MHVEFDTGSDITTLTVHNLHSDAALLEIDGWDEKLVLKWWTDVLTDSNYDAIILANQMRHILVPDEFNEIQIAKKLGLSTPTLCTVLEFPES